MAADTRAPAQIAARLSDAERQAISCELVNGMIWSPKPSTAAILFATGLTAFPGRAAVLTSLGLAVRAEVEKEAGL